MKQFLENALSICVSPEVGKYANKVLRLQKSIYGLKLVGKTFMNQLGDEVMKFVERVEYKSPGDDSVYV
jgi:hypothetical protein